MAKPQDQARTRPGVDRLQDHVNALQLRYVPEVFRILLAPMDLHGNRSGSVQKILNDIRVRYRHGHTLSESLGDEREQRRGNSATQCYRRWFKTSNKKNRSGVFLKARYIHVCERP